MRSHQPAESEKLATSVREATLFPFISSFLKNVIASAEQCVILSLYFPFKQSAFVVNL